jgi:hypothetical protein
VTTAELVQMRVKEVAATRERAMVALDDMRRALAALDRTLQFLSDSRHPEATREVKVELGGSRA